MPLPMQTWETPAPRLSKKLNELTEQTGIGASGIGLQEIVVEKGDKIAIEAVTSCWLACGQDSLGHKLDGKD
eukprot:4062518-Amphidinium_carterae.1